MSINLMSVRFFLDREIGCLGSGMLSGRGSLSIIFSIEWSRYDY